MPQPVTESVAIEKMQEPLYQVHLDTVGCVVVARVNDCVVLRAPGSRGITTAAGVNEWLKMDRNNLLVEIRPLPDEEKLAADRARLRGRVTAVDMKKPESSRSEVKLIDFELDLKSDKGQYPLRIEKPFNVVTPFPEWLWMRSAPLKVDDGLKREAMGLVNQVWTGLSKGDVDGTLKLQALKLKEMAQALFQTEAAQTADVRADLNSLVNDADAGLRPLVEADIEYDVQGDGRIARVVDGGGRPAIRFNFKSTTMFAGVPIYLTRGPRGRLAWVR